MVRHASMLCHWSTGNWAVIREDLRLWPLRRFPGYRDAAGIERVGAPIVQNEQRDSRKLVDQTWEATVEAGHGVLEQAWHTKIEDGMIEPDCLAPEGTRQPGFAGSGQAGDDEVPWAFSQAPCASWGVLRRFRHGDHRPGAAL
jgi:hypothetical protein